MGEVLRLLLGLTFAAPCIGALDDALERGAPFCNIFISHGSCSVPTLSFFYGILIQMFWNDHAPPHFHWIDFIGKD